LPASKPKGTENTGMGNLSFGDRVKKAIEVLYYAVRDMLIDNGPQWAAAIAFYSLVSIFPLLLAITSIAGLFADEQWVVDQIQGLLSSVLPEGEFEIAEVVEESVAATGGLNLFSIGFWLWSGSRVFSVLIMAMNIAFNRSVAYSFFKRVFVELTMLLTLGMFFVVALTARLFLPQIMSALSVLDMDDPGIWGFLLEVFYALLLALAFYLIYKFVPRQEVHNRAAAAGALVATLLFLAGRPLFQTWLNNFAEYDLIYGSIAMIVIVSVWAWIVSMMVIYGGEVASHVQMMIIEGMPAEKIMEKHKARSPAYRSAEQEEEDDEEQKTGTALTKPE
jgi:membrane protein